MDEPNDNDREAHIAHTVEWIAGFITGAGSVFGEEARKAQAKRARKRGRGGTKIFFI